MLNADIGVVEARLHTFSTLDKTGDEIVTNGTDTDKLELLRLAGDDCTSALGIDRYMAEILVNHYRESFERVRVRHTSPLPTGAPQ